MGEDDNNHTAPEPERLATVEQALRESELRYRTLFETASDAIFLMRKDRFVDCNARTLLMFGCTREQIIGQSPYRFSPSPQSDDRRSESKAQEKIQLALTEGPQRFEWTHCKLDGTPFAAEVSLNRLELGDEVLLQAIVRDMSERKRIEEALERYREHLEESVSRRLVALMGGRVWVTSDYQVGSVFGFTVPARSSEEGEA